MFTKNFYTIMNYSTSLTSGTTHYTTVTGSSENMTNLYSYITPSLVVPSAVGAMTLTGNGPSISLGSGTTPPTENDYTLESPLQGISQRLSSYDPTTGTKVFVLTNTNNNNPVTISEYGFVVRTGNTSYHCLYFRDIFPTPITLAKGDTCTLTLQVPDYAN